MKTITFYSYKGGVGRSLLVANAAKYLSTLGKSVFAIDLDLEAPGLHYKFALGTGTSSLTESKGVVDILANFVRNSAFPQSLSDFVTRVTTPEGAGVIDLMRAGKAPKAEYWEALSSVNWFELFYGEEPVGAPFFLELKQRIEQEFQPEFLLIDARTGITEMGSIAATLLPDTVVCLALASIEHLDGMRAVMRGILQTTERESIKLVPVVSRLPVRGEGPDEISAILAFLNEPLNSGAGLKLDQIVVLHAEPLLDSGEQLLVGSKNSPQELPLLRDYLRLFSRIIPAEDIRPHVGRLISVATGRILDDPDGAQSDLEALTMYCADEEAYKALLKLYALRRAPLEKRLGTAALMWQLRQYDSEPDPLIVEVVSSAFSEPRMIDVQRKHAEFAAAIWRSTGFRDPKIGLALATALSAERRQFAVQLLLDYVDNVESPDSMLLARLLEMLRPNFERASEIIDRFKSGTQTPEFYAAWARLVSDRNERSQAQRVLDDRAFREEAVRAADPLALYRLRRTAGAVGDDSLLSDAAESVRLSGNPSKLRHLAETYLEEGRLDELPSLLRESPLPSAYVKDVIDTVRKRGKRGRYFEAAP